MPFPHWQGSVRRGCRVLHPPLEISINRQNCNPHKPTAQPCCSPQYRPNHTYCTLKRLHLTMQCPMTWPGLGNHPTLAGLCALWLPSAASSSGNLHKPAKPQPPQTTCPALPQPPVQAVQHLLHIVKAAFDLAVSHGMPRAGHSHTGRALCVVVAECCLLIWKSPYTAGKTATPTNHLPGPAEAPSPGSCTPSAQCRGCI